MEIAVSKHRQLNLKSTRPFPTQCSPTPVSLTCFETDVKKIAP